jgi:protein-S-isoprenylcysteine O-methyltransferase Ste14
MDANLWTGFVNVIVIAGTAYLSFVMALAGWVAGLRRGEAVTLLPVRGDRSTVLAAQLGLVLVGLLLAAVLLFWLWVPLPLPLTAAAALILEVVGLALFVGGAVVVVWARRTLGRMWGISTSRQVKLLPDHQLVTSGPYRLVRHPMYSGWWAAVLGLLLIYRTWILVLLLVMSLAVFYRRARLEDRVLAARFGAEWQRYTSQARFLIPFIW